MPVQSVADCCQTGLKIGVDMRPDRIEEAEERRVIGANGRFTRATRHEIPALWSNWAYDKVTGTVGDMVFGVSHGFGPDTFDYMCALQVTPDAPVPDGQQDLILPSGPHAVFVHNGHVSGIAPIFDALLSGADLGEGWSLAPGPQYEVYSEDFDPMTATGRVELWFPIRKA